MSGLIRDVLGDPTFSLIFDMWPDAIVIMREDGTIAGLNENAERMFGWRLEEVIGSPMAELIIPGRYRERHTRGMARYLETGEGPLLGRWNEIDAVSKDGDEFKALLYICPLVRRGWFRRSETVFVGFMRDALHEFSQNRGHHGPQRPFPN